LDQDAVGSDDIFAQMEKANKQKRPAPVDIENDMFKQIEAAEEGFNSSRIQSV